MTLRPTTMEERRLLNPAFSGVLIARAVAGYQSESQKGLPFLYSYLILPLVLHSETRNRLPSTVVTRLINWTERNTELTTHFSRRMADLALATKEGLLLITTTGLAHIVDEARIVLVATDKTFANFEKATPSDEVSSCCKKAHFVGRWLASSGTAPTVLTALGVRL